MNISWRKRQENVVEKLFVARIYETTQRWKINIAQIFFIPKGGKMFMVTTTTASILGALQS